VRFPQLSDTHGKLGIINELAAEVGADEVPHAGNFASVFTMPNHVSSRSSSR